MTRVYLKDVLVSSGCKAKRGRCFLPAGGWWHVHAPACHVSSPTQADRARVPSQATIARFSGSAGIMRGSGGVVVETSTLCALSTQTGPTIRPACVAPMARESWGNSQTCHSWAPARSAAAGLSSSRPPPMALWSRQCALPVLGRAVSAQMCKVLKSPTVELAILAGADPGQSYNRRSRLSGIYLAA